MVRQVLIQASFDKILFLRGHASTLGAGLGLWVDVRLQLVLPPAFLFIPFPLVSRLSIANDAAHSFLCRAVNLHSVNSRPVYLPCLSQ